MLHRNTTLNAIVTYKLERREIPLPSNPYNPAVCAASRRGCRGGEGVGVPEALAGNPRCAPLFNISQIARCQQILDYSDDFCSTRIPSPHNQCRIPSIKRSFSPLVLTLATFFLEIILSHRSCSVLNEFEISVSS